MVFKNISDSEIVIATKEAVSKETLSTTNVVRHFREIFDRELYLKLGYSSMFLMATKEFGYDRASAQRRVKAMELSIAVPEVLEKIDRSETCLQAAADIQSFLDRERATKRAYSPEQKRELVEKCSLLSTREVEIELASRNPQLAFRESKKFVSKDRLQVTHTIAKSIEDKLERIKQLRSHVNPYMNREELLDYMAEVTLNAIDHERKDERARKRQERKVNAVPAPELEAQVPAPAPTVQVPAPEPTVRVPAPEPVFEYLEEVVSEVGEIQLVARLDERTRYITSADAREVRKKNAEDGCAFTDLATGRRCSSQHQLQFDHIVEFSVGGSNDAQNLQLYCAQHNRFRWRQRRAGSVVRGAFESYG